MVIEYKNLFYVSNFNAIGGVETYIYELTRKYKDKDIAVIYKTGSEEQLKRIRDNVRLIHFDGQKFRCKKAFFNYETDIIDNIEADEYIQVIHACFKTQGIRPRMCDKIDKYLAVSKCAAAEWEEITGIKPMVCTNPLELSEQEKTPALVLVSATRLTPEKGKKRMILLGDMLDRANVNYIWFVFTNDINKINNPNIIYLKPRLNIRPILASVRGKGYGVQLSDSEGDCYFTRECEALGVPLLVTPIPSLKEQGLKDGKNCYFIPFDMQGVNIDKIVNKIPAYEGYGRTDAWDKMLAPGKSKYQKELTTMVKVRCIRPYFDIELNRNVMPTNPLYEVNKIRAETLVSVGVCEEVE